MDRRRPPAVLVERAALAQLADCFAGRRLPQARSIYLALIELAVGHEVDATRGTVAEYAGVTKKTLDEYAAGLEKAGLMARERRADGNGGNLPNVWALLDVGGVGTRSTLGSADHPVLLSSTTPDEKVKKTEGGTRSTLGSFVVAEGDVPEEMVADARGLLAQRRRVDGRVVTDDEMTRAVVALAEFNRQAAADFGIGSALVPLVMRIRERPSYDAAAHVRLVQSAWRLKWWKRNGRGRRPTPHVIYGNANVFEAVVQDAADEKKGNPIEDTPERRGRFTREG